MVNAINRRATGVGVPYPAVWKINAAAPSAAMQQRAAIHKHPSSFAAAAFVTNAILWRSSSFHETSTREVSAESLAAT